MPQISRAMGALDWGQLLLLSIIWGGSYFFVAVAIGELPPLIIVFGRVAIAAIVLLLVMRLSGETLPMTLAWWRPIFVMSLLNNVIPFNLIAWGQTEIASGLAAIFNATTPLFTVLLAHFMTHDEKLGAGKLLGVLLGLAGVVVLIGPDALSGLGSVLVAQFAMLAAALSYALSGIFARRFRDRPPLSTAAAQMTASTTLMLPLVLAFEPPWRLAAPGFGTLAAVLSLALFSTSFAYLLVFRILRSAGATNFSLVTFLIPPTAILLGALFLGERLEASAFAGMALIGLGLAAIDGRPAAMLMRAARSRV